MPRQLAICRCHVRPDDGVIDLTVTGQEVGHHGNADDRADIAFVRFVQVVAGAKLGSRNRCIFLRAIIGREQRRTRPRANAEDML
jgi:hypothetical protein